jgi:hypothetical protein
MRDRQTITTAIADLRAMKTSLLIAAALFLSAGCSKADKDNAAAVAQDIKATAIDSWNSVKDFTFEKRAEFSAYLARTSDDMDSRVTDLKSKGRTVPDYDDARADLKTSLENLNNATVDTWADAKAKAVRAWDRVKADYEKAKDQSP